MLVLRAIFSTVTLKKGGKNFEVILPVSFRIFITYWNLITEYITALIPLFSECFIGLIAFSDVIAQKRVMA